MNDGLVLISTHDLETAGALRDVFDGAGYAVELVTPGEEIADFDDAVLLVLTRVLEAEDAEGLATQAREALHVPVYAVAEERDERWRRTVRELGLDEIFFQPVEPDEVLLLGRTLIERRRLQEVTGIVGETEEMREVLERVVQIAPVKSTVLVTGESGTGKELVARGIHALSPRKHGSFIAVNVAALSETLLESELFGHEKGAFTGAVDTRKGFFELAAGGTIFLDEIGEMPLSTQTKLLRVLEQREFLRVGGEEPIRVDVRIITATNQNLRQLVQVGDFRRDLYYRLNVLHIELPPLRERTEDIPLLVDAFIEEISESHDRSFAGISAEAMEILKRYHWPGNVRELRNLVESMVVLSPGQEIGPEDIPDEIRHPERESSLLPAPMARRAARSRGGEEDENRPGRDAPPREGEGAAQTYRPQLEFIFRTLMELRMDMDDLRKEFEAYKEDAGEILDAGRAVPLESGSGRYEIEVTGSRSEEDEPHVRVLEGPGAGGEVPRAEIADEGERAEETAGKGAGAPGGESGAESEVPGDGQVVYRPGMTMDDLEREAIVAALEEVDGNRRKAAESLGIGERTLYRKIRKYELDV